jgi:hypothetical protein
VRVSKQLFALLATTSVVGSWLWIQDVISDRRTSIEIVRRVPLFADLPDSPRPVSAQQGTLEPGQPVRVLRIRYGKDYRAIRVETSRGQTGWLLDDGAAIRELPKDE